jgi:hypothetical protein
MIELLKSIEAKGLTWDIGHLMEGLELREWQWPNVENRTRYNSIFEIEECHLRRALVALEKKGYKFNLGTHRYGDEIELRIHTSNSGLPYKEPAMIFDGFDAIDYDELNDYIDGLVKV